jgi:hypothetical protein
MNDWMNKIKWVKGFHIPIKFLGNIGNKTQRIFN